ncbi:MULTISPECIES: CRISPR-associated endonuclease Cas2 [unclassified Synechocystis]|uniref:CRISPR-associated endonuclease Cas2 n=1 Tax=unclassified Synechocystis TaxID=2640012 RepID=UPI000425735A|nr:MULTISPECIES: CRISPR-associated endonuclease Cas2 [unclassified Synechocystis]AIE73549.1 CRISPR-associated protein Cas2 [Synechocystis sp. PCC 6714]
MLYIICYDIPDDRRRKKVADLLEGYGVRVQYSVFECYLSAKKLKELQRRLRKQFNQNEDSIRFYPLSPSMLSQTMVWGSPPLSTPSSSVII